MAIKNHFEAEDTDYPYQVVVRKSDGTYVGKCAMSASLGAYTKGSAGVSSQAQASPLNGSPLTIRFTDYDWALCSPLPSDYSTDEAIMAYLSTLFTGQYGTLVPPITTAMNLILTQPIGIIDNGVDGTSYMALSSTQGVATTAAEAYTALNFNGNTVSIHAIVSSSGTDSVIEISLCKYDGGETELLKMSIPAATDGVVKFQGSLAIVDTDYLYYKILIPVGSGTLYLSPITMEIEAA